MKSESEKSAKKTTGSEWNWFKKEAKRAIASKTMDKGPPTHFGAHILSKCALKAKNGTTRLNVWPIGF